MKVYMHWDMEGCSGLFHRDQTWYWYPHVPEATKEQGLQLLMADINAAVGAALDAGADHVYVCDTHHGGNIRIPDMRQDHQAASPRSYGLTIPKRRSAISRVVCVPKTWVMRCNS